MKFFLAALSLLAPVLAQVSDQVLNILEPTPGTVLTAGQNFNFTIQQPLTPLDPSDVGIAVVITSCEDKCEKPITEYEYSMYGGGINPTSTSQAPSFYTQTFTLEVPYPMSAGYASLGLIFFGIIGNVGSLVTYQTVINETIYVNAATD